MCKSHKRSKAVSLSGCVVASPGDVRCGLVVIGIPVVSLEMSRMPRRLGDLPHAGPQVLMPIVGFAPATLRAPALRRPQGADAWCGFGTANR